MSTPDGRVYEHGVLRSIAQHSSESQFKRADEAWWKGLLLADSKEAISPFRTLTSTRPVRLSPSFPQSEKPGQNV